MKKAIISVSSKQVEIDENLIEVVTPGEFIKEDGYYYVSYNETEISGMQGTKTTLKVFPDKLILIRVGTTNAEMNFEEGKEHVTLYNTPHGILELRINTKDLNINVDDNGGDVMINYSISISNQPPLNTNLKINIKS